MKAPTSTTEQATRKLAQWEAMKSTRFNWMIRWDDCARYISPRKGNILTKYTPGQDQTINIYDTTAEEALNIFAAGCLTHIVPAGEKWFRFEPKMKNPTEDQKDALSRLSDLAIDLLVSSNFYLGIHEDFLDAGCFGTSCLLGEEGKKAALNFTNIPVGTFAIDEDDEGNVDTVAREFKWTARQAEQKWGREALGPNVKAALDDKNPSMWNKTFTFVHFVEPRKDANYKGGLVAPHIRPVASIYLCVEDTCVVDEGGYYSMPYFTSRLLRSNNEVYGRGPGIQTLAEIRLVNAMERDLLIGVEKMVNPPWLVPDDTSNVIDGRPNGITYYDSTNPANKPEQMQLKNRIDLGEQKTEQKRQRIRRAFYNDLFQLLTNLDEQRREKTAYEVQQMVAEKLLLFSPLFARFAVETLNPLLERVVDIMFRSELLPPDLAAALAGVQYEIVYTSKIALAIKAAENQAFATMMTLIEQAAALDPTIVNIVKWNDGIRRIARNVGLPAALIRTDREAARITAGQQQAARAQQQAQTAELATRSVKNLGPQAQTAAARKIIAGAGQPAAAA